MMWPGCKKGACLWPSRLEAGSRCRSLSLLSLSLLSLSFCLGLSLSLRSLSRSRSRSRSLQEGPAAMQIGPVCLHDTAVPMLSGGLRP